MAAADLASLADVKAWLQLGATPFPATDDALLSRLVTAASGFIAAWLDRGIAPAAYVELRDGTGGSRLVLANFPVTAVTSLTIDGVPVAAADSLSGQGYRVSTTQLSLQSGIFTRGAANIRIAYTAGYAPIPPEIAQACIELVAQRYRERGRTGETAKALRGGDSVTFSQKDLSEGIRANLRRYRAVSPLASFGSLS